MNKKYTFLKPITKSNNDFIQLDFILAIEKPISTNEFINTYKISNFWKGKFFIKKLIKRVFKYRLNHPMEWNINFWGLIKVYKLKYTYTLPESIQNLDELYLELSQGDTKKRFDDIKKYRELIKKDINLNYPLFISGKVLNLLGADIHDNDIYFLDGTRRLFANILNDNKNNKALIIDT